MLTTGPNIDYPTRYVPGQIQVLLSDGTPLGTYSISQNGTFNLGAVPLKAGLNSLVIRTIHGTVDPSYPSDDYHYWFQPTSLSLNPSFASPSGVVINNGAVGYSETGPWSLFAGVGYDSDDDEALPGTGSARADWTFTGLAAGSYVVMVVYPAASNRATDAPFSVYDGSTLLGTMPVDQQEAAVGSVDASGVSWQPPGTFTISGTTLEVALSNLADGRVEADAVRILRVPASTAAVQVVNNSDPGYFGGRDGLDADFRSRLRGGRRRRPGRQRLDLRALDVQQPRTGQLSHLGHLAGRGRLGDECPVRGRRRHEFPGDRDHGQPGRPPGRNGGLGRHDLADPGLYLGPERHAGGGPVQPGQRQYRGRRDPHPAVFLSKGTNQRGGRRRGETPASPPSSARRSRR